MGKAKPLNAMTDARICKMRVGGTICGKLAVGYVRVDLPDPLPPGVTREGMTLCEEHAEPIETAASGPAFVRYN